MRLYRFLALGLLAAGVAVVSADSTWSADPKAVKKLEKKKAADATKAAEAKKSADAKAVAAKGKVAGKDDPTPNAAPLVPKAIGKGRDAPAVAAVIDTHVSAKLAEAKLAPSPVCTDAEFVRRASLDIAGVIPTSARAKAFLDDASPDKRAKLVDELLASADYGRRQADIWNGLLIERSSDNRRVDFSSFRPWFADQFNTNPGWDKTVTQLITASGDQEKNPATGFFLSNNTVDKMTNEVTKTFLGVQLQCAQCHNHPFTAWKQTEYWGMAQFFMKVQVSGNGKDATPAVTETNAVRRNAKMNTLPESAKVVDPKFLQADPPKTGKGEMYRPLLAKWLTDPTNPFFAKAMVNRTWAQFFGRGFVNPIDDMHDDNPASHPELLQLLAADFAAGGFDVKHLVRSICNSRAYQTSSKPAAGNDTDTALFSHMTMKVLAPEQLYDSVAKVTGGEAAAAAKGGNKMAAGKAAAVGPRERFVTFYLAGAEQPNAVDYEPGIPQALKLMNSRIAGNPGAVRKYVAGTPAATIENLYLAALSRRPTADEAKKMTAYVAKAATPVEGFTDVLWVLLNGSEFTLNR